MDRFVKELLETYDKEQLEKAIKEMSSCFSDENSTTEEYSSVKWRRIEL